MSRFVVKPILIAAAAWLMALPAHAQTLDSAINKNVQRTNNAQQSQKKIDQVDAKARDAEREYRAVMKEVDGLNVYIEQLNKQLSSQEQELKEIADSIRQVTLIERQITPLMLKMIDALEQFIAADLPFQKGLRESRVASLKDLMGRSDVTVAEKYRKVLDAYQTEMDYGRTIKTYRASINVDGKEKEVDFLRVGRIALMYQTLDSEQLGVWDSESLQFTELDSSYRSKLAHALRIAREQAAPDLIKIPVAAPVTAKGAQQ